MDPVLFEIGEIHVYSYGFFIAFGAIAGVLYLYLRGKEEVGITFDQVNTLFLCLFLAAVLGGKVFLFLESPNYYLQEPRKLFSGNGFVFYGSFIFCVPTMWWLFKRYKLPVFVTLDVMAVTTCLVHLFGRIGCFMAGCCYGLPTHHEWGVVFTEPACYAHPKGVALHPVQLYEATYIGLVMVWLLMLRAKRKFYGQLFLVYLMLYAVGRYGLEFFRGDVERGFIVENYVSHAQAIALIILLIAALTYFRLSKVNRIENGLR